MILIRHELRQGKNALILWAASIGFLIATCVLLFPEMKAQMDGVSALFASMGAFTRAFGMDKISFGALTGFYAVECGNILSLGGAFFAALTAAAALSREERDHTAEFLLTHPVSRARIVLWKLAAVLIQLLLLNVAVFALSVASVAAMGEAVPWREIGLLHLACLLMQVELAGICFGLSAFLRRGSAGAAMGLASLMYFLNIAANLSPRAEFLKYVTPFGYADGPQVISACRLDGGMVLAGVALCALGIAAAFLHYCRKDIR